MKSGLIAYRVAWELTKDPTLRVLYISATSNLAEKQLGFIKNILTSDIYRRYWPQHTHVDEGKRTKWTSTEISLDHPDRLKENIRDPSIFCAGLTTTIVGMHCDIAVLDDVVIHDNAYNKEGRDRVSNQYALLSSVESAGAREWVVGTRYHPKDLYSEMLEMIEDTYDKDGEHTGSKDIYEVYDRAVEDRGDGTGVFLWPRQQRRDGKWFGFDASILARKRGKYRNNMLQYRAQYYNDPNDPDSQPISNFQYYDQQHLKMKGGTWYMKDKKLNLQAAMDFNYSTSAKADSSCIVLVGVDEDNNFYILDIERFKTDRIPVYFDKLLKMYNKWSFRKLVAETNAAQQAIVRSLKEDYLAPHGLPIKVEEVKPNSRSGNKAERIDAILSPRYDNNQMYHYRGGMTQMLEEELISYNPPHDDIKDALSNAVDKAVKPFKSRSSSGSTGNVVNLVGRFRG